MKVERLAGSLGAEVTGLDVRRISNTEFDALHRAFLDHQVLAIRDQDLTPDEHKDFGRRFGPLKLDLFIAGMEGHPEIMEIVKEPHHTINFAGNWHADVTFFEEPPLGSALYAREVPGVGGDTLFANQAMAWDMLSETMRDMLGRLKGVHCAFPGYDMEKLDEAYFRQTGMKYTRRKEAPPEVLHPIGRTHPETGRVSLFVNRSWTTGIAGLSHEESRPILDFLWAHGERPEFTCRVRWAPGTLVLLDNRCVLHLPLNDYQGHRRVLHRVTIAGDRPR